MVRQTPLFYVCVHCTVGSDKCSGSVVYGPSTMAAI